MSVGGERERERESKKEHEGEVNVEVDRGEYIRDGLRRRGGLVRENQSTNSFHPD